MTDDIVARLRDLSSYEEGVEELCENAANEIEWLLADNKQLERMWLGIIDSGIVQNRKTKQVQNEIERLREEMKEIAESCLVDGDQNIAIFGHRIIEALNRQEEL